MLEFESFELSNGLKVLVHQDHSTSMAVLNLMYDVGSRDEDENKTGFAHLFEHLMFGGSANIPDFDGALQRVGGENNAFTSPDLTNYYMNVPAANLETAFWLESDRMFSLSFDPQVLEIQRKVVIEEFKQRYLNQPYGDIWLKLRPLCYHVHPYRWATIGKEISHIEDATMEDVKSFFRTFYVPNNAVLVVGGNVEVQEVKRLAEKWFGPIPAGQDRKRTLPQEPEQTEPRALEVEAQVPVSALYKAYHMPDRLHPDYYAYDLLSDIMGRGKSSRLHSSLVVEKRVFNSLQGYVTSSTDDGLIVFSGKLSERVTMDAANEEIEKELDLLLENGIDEDELTKVKNQALSTLAFGRVDLLERCISLAYASLLGNEKLVNEEAEMIERITKEDVDRVARQVFRRENASTLKYFAQEK